MDHPAEFYASDLAFVHDKGYSQHARDAAAFLLDLFRDQNYQPKQILDLGCGSGNMAALLSEKGFKVTGLDYSLEMIRLAKQNAPKAEFRHGSIYDSPLIKSDVVCLIGEVINYLFDKSGPTSKLNELFHRIENILPSGGYLLLDFIKPGISGPNLENKRVVEHENWTMFLEFQEDEALEILERKITLFLKVGNQYRKSIETHRSKLHRPEVIKSMLDNCGFDTKFLDRYGADPFRNNHQAILAKKN